ncbi:prepilin-type N-terminal cleavage/methylation domain-containing protein [Longimicrobium sp.]|uniref:prepilin-type N-terminal cleavage/methylation domain-containing protein n=1 Tax=Longimicrobium sp. TaxID=2029185 RepID=UPI003B3A4C09
MTHPPPVCGSRRPPPGPRSGYSLVEVMLVLVLMGILLALAGPRINLSPTRTEAGVQALASELMAAQRAAVSGQHDVVVAFDQAQRRLRVHFDLDNDGVMDSGEPVQMKPLERGVVFGRGSAGTLAQLGSQPVSFTRTQGGLRAVTFNRAGSASEEGGAYLSALPAVSPPASSTRAVLVDRATARAMVWRYTGSAWQRRF